MPVELARKRILVFARDQKKRNNVTVPFTYLGPVEMVNYERERPIKMVWRTGNRLPQKGTKYTKLNLKTAVSYRKDAKGAKKFQCLGHSVRLIEFMPAGRISRKEYVATCFKGGLVRVSWTNVRHQRFVD